MSAKMGLIALDGPLAFTVVVMAPDETSTERSVVSAQLASSIPLPARWQRSRLTTLKLSVVSSSASFAMNAFAFICFGTHVAVGSAQSLFLLQKSTTSPSPRLKSTVARVMPSSLRQTPVLQYSWFLFLSESLQFDMDNVLCCERKYQFPSVNAVWTLVAVSTGASFTSRSSTVMTFLGDVRGGNEPPTALPSSVYVTSRL